MATVAHGFPSGGFTCRLGEGIMQIPKRFKLFGQTIEVKEDPNLWHDQNYVGLADYRNNRITLQSTTEGCSCPVEQIEQTFCHELLHHLFDKGGYADDRGNEDKVDMLASLLHQALTTMEYE
jgi:hypothetical protein